tara:strand:+ start:223 stop:414 length:192 start_codon:yes stop_codon:yes gene_type:complete
MSEEESNIERIKAGKSIFKEANFSEQQLVNIEHQLIQSYYLTFFNSLMLGVIAIAVVLIAIKI